MITRSYGTVFQGGIVNEKHRGNPKIIPFQRKIIFQFFILVVSCAFFHMLETNNLRIIEIQRKHDGCDSWDIDFTLLSTRKINVDPQNGWLVF